MWLKRFILYSLCLIVSANTFGQSDIKGLIIDSADKEPLPGVTVLLKDSLNKICAYTSTDVEGRFSISPKPVARTIEFSMIGYSKQSFYIRDYNDREPIVMQSSSEQLKNINVTSSQIKEQGDTLTYYVATFAKEQDKSIGDVLKRMPGLKVDDSGKIQYQGSDINRFYIEGNDMLGGRYGVATNGISASDIGSVVIMENHQPLQVLGGIAFSDRAALNLKLKEGSKSTWLFQGGASGGFSLNPFHGLWDGNFFTMAVMPKFQTLMTLKSNNIGRDISEETSDFNSSARNTELTDYYTLTAPATATLGAARERMNVSHLLSLNQLWKISDKYDLKAQFDYNYNRNHSRSESLTTYLLEEDNKLVSEIQTGHRRENILDGSITLTANERSFYLNNTLTISTNWDNGRFMTRGTDDNRQEVTHSNIYLSNSFSMYRRFHGNRLIKIESVTEWENMPHSLGVQREESFAQRLRNHAFYNEERSSYRLQYKGWGIAVEAGLKAYLSGLSARTPTIDFPEGNFSANRNYFSVYTNPSLQKSFARIDISFQCPLNYTHYSFGDVISNKNKCLYSPSLTLRWMAPGHISASVSGSIGNSAPPIKFFYSGVIASDYRIFEQGPLFFELSTRQRVSAFIRYRNTPKGLFADAMAMLAWNTNPYTRSRNIVGDNVYYGYDVNRSHGRMFTLMWNASKTLKSISGGFFVNGIFTRTRRKTISQSHTARSYDDMLTVNAKVYSSPCRLLYLQYQFKINFSALHYMNSDKCANISNSLQCTVYPFPKVYVDLVGEFYKTGLLTDTKKSVPMLDTKITYKLSKTIEISTSVTNIFNRDKYSLTNYGLLSSITTTTFMRGREFLVSINLKR